MSDWLVDDSLAPNSHGVLAPLFEAGARGELALPHCGQCGQPMELEQVRCDRCGSADAVWATVEPTGSVHSVTTVHRLEAGLIRSADPYPIVDVELASGHRLIMTTDHPAAAPLIGDPARIVFRHVAGVAVPALAAAPEPHLSPRLERETT